MNKLMILFFAAILLSCGSDKPLKQDTPIEGVTSNTIHFSDAQIKNSKLMSNYPLKKALSATLKLNGRIEVPPQNKVSVSVPLGGYVKSTKLLPGMHVTKGEVIAEIEDQQYINIQQDYLMALAKLNFLETDYSRQKSLNENKASSDKTLQQTESDYKTLLVSVKALFEKLKLIGINPAQLNENTLSRSIQLKAPINGFVSSVNVNIGKYVTPSEVVFELVNPDDIHLSLRVFEKDLGLLEIGQTAEAYSNSQPQKKYKCEIILISQNFSNDRSVEVHCHFQNYDKTLIPGMYMNADVYTKTEQAVVVPESAVVSFEGKQYVFIDHGKGDYEMQETPVGITEAGFTSLPSLTNSNQRIVCEGAYQLLMALKNKAE